MPPTPTPEAPADTGVLQWAPAVYLAATGIGVVMRLMMVGVPSALPFDHLLHAHSHALYFRWAALAVLGAGAATAATRRWAWAGLGLVVPMTVAFLLQGYGPYSIAASAAVMVAWYGAMLRWPVSRCGSWTSAAGGRTFAAGRRSRPTRAVRRPPTDLFLVGT